MRLHFYGLAIAGMGRCYSFTLRFRDDIEQQARAQKVPASWLLKRLAYRLESHLGRPVALFFAMEEDDNRRLHLHGIVQADEREIGRARKALREAVGEWPKEDRARQHQCLTKPDPDPGWTAYSAKGFINHRPAIRRLLANQGSSIFKPTFPGGWIACTRDVNQAARSLYSSMF